MEWDSFSDFFSFLEKEKEGEEEEGRWRRSENENLPAAKMSFAVT